ncbi:MAG: MBL fold metallo-hydrolase [Burkholderiaceae bacterium]
MRPDSSASVIDYPHGISAIDSGYVRPHLDAIHLIVEKGRAAVVDSGTNDSIPFVLDTLAAKGLGPDAIDFVFLTHVHLDHAGGAGLLMQKAPNAKLVVHPRGVGHMIDPGKLMAATRDVYGVDAARRMFGDIVPVARERMMEATDGYAVELAGRTFTFYDTPGHARHHNCIHDGATGHLFVGDMFGLSYRELDRNGIQFIFPATTPSQFDPDAFHASIARMTALKPDAIYLTHYGKVSDVPRLAKDLLRLVDAHAEAGRRCARIADGNARAAALKAAVHDIVLAEAKRQPWGVDEAGALEVLVMDIQLNADGLESWIARGGASAPRRAAAR